MPGQQFSGAHFQALGLFNQIIKTIFLHLRAFWSVSIPQGFKRMGTINGPGDLPGYFCIDLLDLVKLCWELV